MIIHSPIISGSLTFADGATFTLPDNGVYSGSFSGSITGIGDPTTFSASVDTRIDQLSVDTGSQDSRLDNLEGFTSSIDTTIKSELNIEGVFSSSAQVNADSITNFDTNVLAYNNSLGVISGSSQVNADTITNFDSNVKSKLDSDGVISGSSQVVLNDANKTGFDTTDVSEGTNLYYTDTRVKTKLNTDTVVSGSSQILTLVSIDEDTMTSNSDTKLPTQQSVKSYVDTKVANLVDSAPGALDTLNELAAALGDDASFSTTVSNTIAGKVSQSLQIISGNGLTGGGNLTTDRTLNVVGTTDRISVSADAVDISATYVGQSSITTLGTITTGTWSATTIDKSKLDDEVLNTSLNSYTASNDTTNTAQNARLTSLETKTGSLDTEQTAQNARLTSIEAATASLQGTDITITLTGDVTGTGTITNLGNVSFATTVAANSVALGTDTTGNYMSNVSAGNAGIVVSHTPSEGSTATISLVGGVVSGSSQVNADSITNFDTNVLAYNNSLGVISGSSQVNADSITNFDTNVKDKLNADTVVSGSSQILSLVSIDEDTMSSNSDTKLPTQQSVKTYVDNKVSALVDSAPGALDTLNELAAALGDDANFSTTISTTIAGKVSQSLEVISGNGLTGGGNLTTNRTLAVGAGDGISVSADAVAVDGTVLRTTGFGVVSGSSQIDITLTTGTLDISSRTNLAVSDTTNVDMILTGDTLSANLKGGVVSGSSQVDITSTTGTLDISSRTNLAVSDTSQVDMILTGDTLSANLKGGVVSGSSQVVEILSSLNSYTASNDTTNTAQNSRLTSIEAATASLQGTDISITLTGDVTGTGTITNLGNVSFATTIAANSVALGTDTTGNYVGTITAGNGIVSSGATTGEGVAHTLSVGGGVVSGSAQIDALGFLQVGGDDVVSGSATVLRTTTNFGGDVTGTYNAIVITDDSHNHIISNVDGLQSALDLKAPLASPTFTGTVIAPTPADNDDSTKVATTAFVMREIADLIGTAPAALDTLGEISASLAADSGSLASLVTVVSGKLQKDQNLSDLTNASTARTNLGLAIGTNVQAYDAGLAWLDSLNFTNEATFKAGVNLEIGTDVQAYNSTLAAVAGGTYTGDDSITTLGTIGTGTWQGTAIASAYLDADTAHLTTTQTFSGAKTFSAITTISNATASTTKTTGALVVTGGVGVSGALNVGGDVVAYASSDERLKNNIELISNPIEKVQQLKGVTWEWNENADELQQSLPNVGVIAQDVEKVLPQLVHDRDNGYKGVDYAKLTGLLIEAIKEQQKQIDELKSRLG